MTRPKLSIGWHLLVLFVVLFVTYIVPDWGTVVGATIALLVNLIGPREWRCRLGLGKPRRPLETLGIGIGGGVALFFFVKLFFQHLCEIITHSQRDLSAFDFIRGDFGQQWPFILRIALTAGFCEEVIFRGTIISRLKAILPEGKLVETLVVLASAAIFGAAHSYQAPAGILLTALIGLFFAYTYISCGRFLWVVIIIHSTYDLLSLSAMSLNLDRILQAWSLGFFRLMGLN